MKSLFLTLVFLFPFFAAAQSRVFDTLPALLEANADTSAIVYQYSSSFDLDPYEEDHGKFYFRETVAVEHTLLVDHEMVCFIGNPKDITFKSSASNGVAAYFTEDAKVRIARDQNSMSIQVISKAYYYNRGVVERQPYEIEKSWILTLPKCKQGE